MEHDIILDGELEIRARGDRRTLAGMFPYNRQATVRDRGRVRKERIGARAFGWQIERFQELQKELSEMIGETIDRVRKEILQEQLERSNIHILSGHEYSKPLGDMKRATARLVDGDDALRFEVDLPSENDMPTWMADTVRSIRAGLAGGISPGFRIPPKNVVPDAEELVDEPGNPGVQIRVIKQAVLHEMSIVTRPSYVSTEVDIRAVYGAERTKRARLWL